MCAAHHGQCLSQLELWRTMAASSGPDVRTAIATPTLAPPGSATCTVTTAPSKVLEGVRAKGPLKFVTQLAWCATRALCVARPLAAPAGAVHGVCEGLYEAVLREYGRSARRKVRDPPPYLGLPPATRSAKLMQGMLQPSV